MSIEVKRMLPEEEEKPEPEKMQEIQDDKSKATMDRLDAAARTLVTATTVLIALLAALGLTADRLTVLLNSSASKNLVIVAVLCAAAAVICGTVAVALSVDHVKWEQRAVALGTAFFLASLIAAVLAASTSFTEDGRPAITEVSVADAAGTAAILSFIVASDGVAQDAGLRVVASWVRNSQKEQLKPPFYSTLLRPSAKGVIQQKATVYLSRPPVDTYVRIQVIRTSDAMNAAQAQALTEPPVGTQCSAQANQKTAPACADVLVPAAAAPSPVPSTS